MRRCRGTAVRPRVESEDADLPGVAAQLPHEDPDCGGFARTVGAEETVDLAGADVEVEIVENGGVPVAFDEATEVHRGCQTALPL